jgi:MFS family permease
MPNGHRAYRWIIELMLILIFLTESMLWLAPAPLLAPIVKSLKIDFASAGLLISVGALCTSVFSLIGATVAERFGALSTMTCGTWIAAIAQILSGHTSSFGSLLACRVMLGIGGGLLIAPPGTLVMEWFGEREWPYVNMVNSLCSYAGLIAVFTLTVPLFVIAGSSWQRVFFWYGVGAATIALGWSILGREAARPDQLSPSASSTKALSTLIAVSRIREVRLAVLAVFALMWVFQFYTAFLPQYFHESRGMSLAEASAMTAILPFAGIFGSLAGGIGTAAIGLRKPFTWPLAGCALLGAAGTILAPNTSLIAGSMLLIGLGISGPSAPIVTLFMELPWMTPVKAGACLAVIWSAANASAFLSPIVGGFLASHAGLRTVMLGFAGAQIVAIAAMYRLPETGPGKSARSAVCAEDLDRPSANQR